MNKTNRFLAVFVVTLLIGGIGKGAFVNDGFERNLGDPVNGGQWRATDASVVISNKAKPSYAPLGTNAAMIPIFKTLTNDVALAASEKKVWTDFWTIPRPYVSANDTAPAVDTGLSAMFFVSNGTWVVVYGNGGSIVTNARSSDIWGTNHVAVNDGSTWCRVSVYHDYGAAKDWSFFVDGRPVVTNVGFINPVLESYEWFSVQNGGGATSNKTWLDDVLVTNRVPSTLTLDDDRDGMSDAWELMYFGTVNSANTGGGDADGDGFNNSQESILGSNPGLGGSPSEPGGTNLMEYVFNAQSPGIVLVDITNATSPAIQLSFSVGSNRSCIVQGASAPNGPFGTTVGTFDTGPNGETNFFVDPNALNARPNPYYYRVVAVSPEGLAVTNAEIYAVYRQSRVLQASVSNFWVGITVDYGESNTLASTLGAQLARGLSGSDLQVSADRVTVYNPNPTVFYLKSNRTWAWSSGPGSVNDPISMGHALMIQRRGVGVNDGADSAVFAGPKVTNTSVSITVSPGWNFLSWPYEGSNSTWQATIGSLNDAIYVYRDNTTLKKLVRYNAGWRTVDGAALTGKWYGYLKFGEGFFYTNAAAGGGTWTP